LVERSMKKLISGLALGAALAAIASIVLRRRSPSAIWDPEDPEGDWGMALSDLQRTPAAAG
jgi:hypothetical protein